MAAPQAEIEAVEQLHQAAQARLGIAAAYVALSAWKDVHALSPEESAKAWLLISLRVILAVQKISRQLAINYYQLVRGLETGSTLGEPANSTGNVTLGDLRKNFRDIALDVAALPSPLSPSSDPDIRWFEEELRSAELPKAAKPGRSIRLDDAEVDPLVQDLLDVEDSSTNSDPVTIDEFDWEEAMTQDEIDTAYRNLLRKHLRDAEEKARSLRSSQELTPDQVITQIEKSHAGAGSMGSGTVDAAGIAGGRKAIDKALSKDRKVKMIARGTSSDPCAFCAMLASRGFVFTGATSGVGANEDFTVSQDIKAYHDHCHCFPIVRFTTTSQLPELNQYFKEQWRDVTDGYSGLDALNAWRRWIYAKRKLNPKAPFGAFDNKNPK